MVFLDGLQSLSSLSSWSASQTNLLRSESIERLSELNSSAAQQMSNRFEATRLTVEQTDDKVIIAGFAIPKGCEPSLITEFRFDTTTTAMNAMRIARACQLPKAVLLEGSPGVGKTSIVIALAGLSGHRLQRINLSDQTDLIDLFGSDLPVEGEAAGVFQWRDAAFLDAMQRGDWVLLDEMNLAPQAILEGLNAVLDHRGSVFIPELGRSFVRHDNFRIFAAQNPLGQGGGRKGLPKSYLNRFTKVYLHDLNSEDMLSICRPLTTLDEVTVQRMIAFTEVVRSKTSEIGALGREGFPWEFNLRDLFRWFRLSSLPDPMGTTLPPMHQLRTMFLQRFRASSDQAELYEVFEETFGYPLELPPVNPLISSEKLRIGSASLPRTNSHSIEASVPFEHFPIAESVMKGIQMGWLVILVGPAGAGKRSLLQTLGDVTGHPIKQVAMHPGADASDLLGTYEQQDVRRQLNNAYQTCIACMEEADDQEASRDKLIQRFVTVHDACNADLTMESIQDFVATVEGIIAEWPTVFTQLALRLVHNLTRCSVESSGFIWVDGDLINALRNGGWFLISEANLCSSSVLDRLNSLCETEGVLGLNEKGSTTGAPEVIRPHPDFRLFMTYDPRHGELSRAMRNRGVELHVPTPSSGSIGSQCDFEYPTSDHTAIRGVLPYLLPETTMGCALAADAISTHIPAMLPFWRRLLLKSTGGAWTASFWSSVLLREKLMQVHAWRSDWFRQNRASEATASITVRPPFPAWTGTDTSSLTILSYHQISRLRSHLCSIRYGFSCAIISEGSLRKASQM